MGSTLGKNCHQSTTPCTKHLFKIVLKQVHLASEENGDSKPRCNFYQHIIFIGRLQLKGMLNTPKAALFGPEQTY